jgi:energy-coupling factor transporter ATP-binding protein EcfA2
VYQYGNETLDFGGGRLLLRGVNGSGKSTAMNMLLPFLLDADTRRIDAAGEQSGVLKAWMLSGRDEPHPQGYLWLEVAKGDAYLNFGFGIRANRSTDQVATWWFITSRRIGHDLHLVEGRVPASRDALRILIEPDSLFGQEQRADYRAELRSRGHQHGTTSEQLKACRTSERHSNLHLASQPIASTRDHGAVPSSMCRNAATIAGWGQRIAGTC